MRLSSQRHTESRSGSVEDVVNRSPPTPAVLQFPAMKRLLFLFLLIPFLAAQTTTEVEITSEPSHHLAVDNEYIRAFQVEIAPHAATLMHRHRHDYFSVALGDTHVSNEVEGKPPVEVRLNDGDTRFSAGNFAHIRSGVR